MSGLGKCGRSTKYSWPVKRNKILTYTTQWMDSENILSKRNQSKSPRVICGSISIEHSRPMNLRERSDWFCAPWFLSTWHKVGSVMWEEGNSNEKMPPSELASREVLGYFLDGWLIRRAEATVRRATPGWVILGCKRKLNVSQRAAFLHGLCCSPESVFQACWMAGFPCGWTVSALAWVDPFLPKVLLGCLSAAPTESRLGQVVSLGSSGRESEITLTGVQFIFGVMKIF